MRHKIISLITILIGSTTLACAQVGKEFWFAAPWMNSHHTGEAEFHLILSAYDNDAHVTISQPANNGFVFADTIVYANSYLDLIIEPVSDHKRLAEQYLEVPYNTISQRGLLIESDQQIGAYYQITHANGEAYTLKGENALGLNFVLSAQNRYPNYANYNGYVSHNNSIQIVATEDHTTVTITPSQPVIQDDGTSSTAAITVTLNRGETYAVKASSTAGDAHLNGTTITSDKPIAVTTSDDSVSAGSGQDAVGEQLVSTDFAGTDYTVVPLQGSNYESFYIISLEPATTVTLTDATSQQTIAIDEAYQTWSTLSNKPTYIHSDKPIQVFQLTNSNGESGGTVLPQMTCTGSKRVTYKRIPNSDRAIVHLLTKTVNTPYFYVNGNEIDPLSFIPVPGTDSVWSYLIMDVTNKPAAMPIEIETKRGVFQMGVKDHASLPQGTLTYGFFSNYGAATDIEVTANDQPLDSALVICEQQSLMLIAYAVDGVESFKWYKDGTLIGEGDTLLLDPVSARNAGHYIVSGESTECTVEDKEFDITTIAVQQTIPLTQVVIDEGESYIWQANGKTYTTHAQDTVWYTVEYEGQPVMGCDTAVALEVSVRSCPRLQINCPTEICGDEAELLIDYTLSGSGQFRAVEVQYDTQAQQAGLTNGEVMFTDTQLQIPLPEHLYANTYDANLIFIPVYDDCEQVTIPIHFLVRYPATVFAQKWNDVLAVYNENYNRGGAYPGYTFVSFQWYKDSQPIVGATGSYYYTGEQDDLDTQALYSVELTRDDGITIRSCDYQPIVVDLPNAVQISKKIVRGQMVIERGEQRYTIYGQPIR